MFFVVPLMVLPWTQTAATSSEEPGAESASAEFAIPIEAEPVAPEPAKPSLLSRLFKKDRSSAPAAPVATPKSIRKDGLLSRIFKKRETSQSRTLVASIGSTSVDPIEISPEPAAISAPKPRESVERAPQKARSKGLIGELLAGIEEIGEPEPRQTIASPEESKPEASGRFAQLFGQAKVRRVEETEQRSERRALLSRLTESFSQERRVDLKVIRTTAYTHTEADHKEWGMATACGTRLQAHRRHNSAAADWSIFPPGTKFRIVGDPTLYVVEDYGRALVGTKTIDIYRPSRTSMNNWGVRNVQIEIVEKGSYEQAREILERRLHHAHCKAMYKAIRPKGWAT